jgi:serine protease Do
MGGNTMKSCKTLTILFSALLMTIPFVGFSKEEIAASKKNKSEQPFPAFTQIAKQAMPATVFIKATINSQPLSGFDLQNPFDSFGDDIFRRFFGFNNGNGLQQMPQQPQVAGGSGFFVSADGYIVTNYHVVKDASKITIVLNDGREFPATVSGSDSRTDLAVLKIDETKLPYLTFGDSDELEIGEWVVAIGSPFALESSLTVGVVSAKGRQDLGISSLEDFIQTDAVINPGNSGGPLLNLSGQVIGVNTAILSRNGGCMGIGFSIPSHMVQHVIDQIMNSGGVHRTYLGVIPQQIDKELADALGLDKLDGVLISDVMKDSPAAKGGLQQGDIILQYNDKAAKSVSKFRNDIALMDPGQIINLKVLRKNSPMDLKIALGVQNESEATLAEMTQKIGIEVENATPEMASRLNLPAETIGVVITKVQPGSPAHLAGLKSGFMITGVAMQGNEPKIVKNTAEFDAALKEVSQRKHIILIVRHQNYQRYYTIKIS